MFTFSRKNTQHISVLLLQLFPQPTQAAASKSTRPPLRSATRSPAHRTPPPAADLAREWPVQPHCSRSKASGTRLLHLSTSKSGRAIIMPVLRYVFIKKDLCQGTHALPQPLRLWGHPRGPPRPAFSTPPPPPHGLPPATRRFRGHGGAPQLSPFGGICEREETPEQRPAGALTTCWKLKRPGPLRARRSLPQPRPRASAPARRRGAGVGFGQPLPVPGAGTRRRGRAALGRWDCSRPSPASRGTRTSTHLGSVHHEPCHGCRGFRGLRGSTGPGWSRRRFLAAVSWRGRKRGRAAGGGGGGSGIAGFPPPPAAGLRASAAAAGSSAGVRRPLRTSDWSPWSPAAGFPAGLSRWGRTGALQRRAL